MTLIEHATVVEDVDTTDEGTAHIVALPELKASGRSEGAPLIGDVQIFRSVKVRLHAIAGEATLSIGELTDLKESSVIALDRTADSLVDVVLDGQVVARGQLVVVGEQFGVRIAELARIEG